MSDQNGQPTANQTQKTEQNNNQQQKTNPAEKQAHHKRPQSVELQKKEEPKLTPMEQYKKDREELKKTPGYKKYHGLDPIRTKPYNYMQLCYHEQIYHKALIKYNKEQAQKEKDYQETYYPNRPKSWAVKPNPNKWMGFKHKDSFHAQSERFRNPDPTTIFKGQEEGDYVYSREQQIPYKRLYVDYNNIHPPALETQYMSIQHQISFVKDPRMGNRLVPHFNTDINTYNDNLPYDVQNQQMNAYNQHLNQYVPKQMASNPNYPQHQDFPIFHSPTIQHNPQQTNGYPFTQYQFY